jgi:hypothetical protein
MKKCLENFCAFAEMLSDLINNLDNFLESIPCKKCNKFNKLSERTQKVKTRKDLRECVKNQYNICQKYLGVGDSLAFVVLKGRKTWNYKGCCPRVADLIRYLSSYQAKKSYTGTAFDGAAYARTTSRQVAWRMIQSLIQMRFLLMEFHLFDKNKNIKFYVVNIDDLNDIMRICGKIGKNA